MIVWGESGTQRDIRLKEGFNSDYDQCSKEVELVKEELNQYLL